MVELLVYTLEWKRFALAINWTLDSLRVRFDFHAPPAHQAGREADGQAGGRSAALVCAERAELAKELYTPTPYIETRSQRNGIARGRGVLFRFHLLAAFPHRYSL